MTESYAYITSMGTFLPGQPISNDEMEKYLGAVDNKPSRLRKRILKSNGITLRHYALDDNQQCTYQNSELAANAVTACLEKAPFDKRDIDMLAVATTQGDLPLPGMASIVQAALKMPACEIITTHGVCSSGMMALKSAVNSVRLGENKNAVVCASELASRLLKKTRYESVDRDGLDFEAEFLRWMLSDGSAAMTVQPQPRRNGLSLRVDWIDIKSYAADFDLCMSCGTSVQSHWTNETGTPSSQVTCTSAGSYSRGSTVTVSDKSAVSSSPCGDPAHPRKSNSQSHRSNPMHAPAILAEPSSQLVPIEAHRYFPNAVSWQDYPTYADAEKAGALLIRQNLRVLEAIVRVGVEGLLRLIQAGKVSAGEIDHFVCHYSSHFFREEILKLFKLLGCDIPEEKWFTNLYTKGNTGSAAMFIALEELLYSGKLKPGQVVFCVVPESGRFCTAYMKMTVVEGVQ